MKTADTYSFENSIADIAEEDVEALIESRVHYGDSWRAEGGFSAFFNIKRKIDRFVKLLGRDHVVLKDKDGTSHERHRYDVFSHIQADLVQGGETTLDTIRDMRRYLLLTEAWMIQQGFNLPPSRDNILANKRWEEAQQAVAEEVNKEVPSAKAHNHSTVRGYDPNSED